MRRKKLLAHLLSLSVVLNGLAPAAVYASEVNDEVVTEEAVFSADLGVSGSVTVNEENFPDTNFREFLLEYYADSEGVISEEILSETTFIEVSFEGIESLEGIQYFKNLLSLECSYNNLTELDVSGNPKLKFLECHHNNLSYINVEFNPELIELSCDNNNLSHLDLSKNENLEDLSCEENVVFMTGEFIDTNSLQGFDIKNVMEWTNAEIADGTIVSAKDDSQPITYIYKCGQGYDREFSFIPVGESVAISEENFPDDIFRAVVSEYDRDGDNHLSKAEVLAVTDLELDSLDIESLEGIEYFENLRYLHCYENKLTTLDVSKNTRLDLLDCSFNDLESLEVSESLRSLYCNDNNLSYVDVSDCSILETFNCDYNQLSNLDLSSNTALVEVFCSNNRLSSLNLSQNRLIEDFYCDNNMVFISGDSVDINSLAGFEMKKASNWRNAKVAGTVATVINDAEPITYTYQCAPEWTAEFAFRVQGEAVVLNETNFPDQNFRDVVSGYDIDGNGELDSAELLTITELILNDSEISNLKGIEFFKNLTELYCDDNNLSSLDISKNTKLKNLSCRSNNLKELNLSQNTKLEYLDCRFNNLNDLDISQNRGLLYLYCASNNLSTLHLYKNPALVVLDCENNQLSSLNLSDNYNLTDLYCSGNIVYMTNSFLDTSALIGFEIGKAFDWTNAVRVGSLVWAEDTLQPISYSYDCGNGFEATFSLIPIPIETFTVEFNANGGSLKESLRSIDSGDSYGTLPVPARTGYKFNGWFTKKIGGDKVTENSIVTSSHMLYAQWEVNEYTVTFNTNGGSKNTSRSVSYGSTYGTLPTPTRSRYKFKGWYTAKSGGSKIAASTKLTTAKNHSVYAQWAKNYKVTFNANGGSVKTKSKTVAKGYAYNTLPAPTRSKYVFKGWYTKKSGGTKITNDSKFSASSNQTLYAKWTKVSVSKGTVSKLTNKSGKKAAVSIKKISGAKGYQVEYSTNKSFKKSTKKATTKTSLTLSRLSKGKTYYVRVRGYKLDSKGKKIYGKYSVARKVKIKK